MKDCLIQKLYGFKGGKIWRINFLHVLRSFEISQFIFIFFVIHRKNIKFQVKWY